MRKMVDIGIAVAIIFLIILLLGDKVSLFAKTINYCEGQCLTTCAACPGGGNHLFAGDGGCKKQGENLICCGCPNAPIDGTDPTGTGARITLTLSDRITKYDASNNKIPVFVGKKYAFTLDLPSSSKDKKCRVYIMDTKNDVSVAVINVEEKGIIKATFSEKCNKDFSGEKNDNIIQKFKDNVFSSLRFGADNLKQNLEMVVIIYKEGSETDVESSAKFFIDLKSPIKISGLTEKWSNKVEFTVSCEQGVQCQQVTYTIPGWPTRSIDTTEMRSVCARTALSEMKFEKTSIKAKGFNSGGNAYYSFGTDINKQDKLLTDTGTSITLTDSIICLHTKIPGIEDGKFEIISTPSEKMLLFDIEPPKVTGVDGLKIECNDKGNSGREGSGCYTYYYYLLPINKKLAASAGDIDDLLREGVVTLVDKIFLGETLSTCPSFSKEARSHSPYITLRGRNVMGSTSALAGKACIYPQDKAGNIGNKAFKTFTNKAKLGDQSRDAFRTWFRNLII